jgi:hypothetical protein
MRVWTSPAPSTLGRWRNETRVARDPPLGSPLLAAGDTAPDGSPRTGLETGDAPPISGPAVRGSRHPRGTMSLTVRTARVEDADAPAALVRE